MPPLRQDAWSESGTVRTIGPCGQTFVSCCGRSRTSRMSQPVSANPAGRRNRPIFMPPGSLVRGLTRRNPADGIRRATRPPCSRTAALDRVPSLASSVLPLSGTKSPSKSVSVLATRRRIAFDTAET